MIDKTKQYKTRDGREVRIYATDGGGECPIHGAVKYESGWRSSSWSINGKFNPYISADGVDDLIECKKQMTIEFHVFVYQDGSRITCPTKESADQHAAKYLMAGNLFARFEYTRIVEEGEGL